MTEENYVEFEIVTSNWVLTNWVAEGQSANLPTEKPITLDFDEENKKVSGSAGCNRYFGNYKLENGVFSTGPLGSTMMLCHEDIMHWETRFLKLLESGGTLSMKDKFLIFKNENNQLSFKPIQK